MSRFTRIATRLFALVVLVLLSTAAFSQAKQYLLLAPGQGRGSTDFSASLAAIGGAVRYNFDSIGVVTALSSDPMFAAKAAKLAGVQSVVEDPEINWIGQEPVADLGTDADAIPGITSPAPFGAVQWNWAAVGADKTFAAGQLGSGARVAVLDAGIVTTHAEFVNGLNFNLALSKSFVGAEPNLDPPPNVFNHGTHVAGIIAARGFRVLGVAPAAEIVAVKVLRASGSGSFSDLIAGIEYASGPLVHADVINMSLGAVFDRLDPHFGKDDGPFIAALNRAINHATANGTLCVSAAGNNAVDLNSRLFSVPAQSGNGIAISATAPHGFALGSTNFDEFASYSNFGLSVVNLAGPGGDQDPRIPTTQNCTVGPLTNRCFVFDFVLSPGGRTATNGNLYFFAAGTSMATPHVSGTAALIVGKFGHIGPAAIKAILQSTATDIFKPGADALSGKGEVNAAAALGVQ